MTRSMTEGAPWKHVIRFAMPVLAGLLLQQLYNTVDAIIVGNFSGEASLSAVGTTASLVFFFLAAATGFSAGNGVVIAQHYGAGDEEKVRTNASAGIFFLMVLGVAAAAAGILVSRPAYVRLMSVPEGYLDLTLTYFRIYAVGLVFQFGYNIFSAILRAVGDSAATLYFLLIASVMNIVLDMAFVAGLRWGVMGAALATDISQAAAFLAAYFYMTRKYPIFRFRVSDYHWDGGVIRNTVKIGFPISLQMMVVSFGFTLIQRAVNGFGQAMTASFTVGQRIEMYLNLPSSAFQTTLATFTGQNIGAGKMDRVKLGLRQTVLIAVCITVCISAAVWMLSGNIITLFGLSDQAAVYCFSHLHAAVFINSLMCLYLPPFGVFQGTNHSGFPMIVSCIVLSIRVAVTYLFRYSAFLGHTVIWWNGLFGLGCGCIVCWIYYFSGRWQKNSRIAG